MIDLTKLQKAKTNTEYVGSRISPQAKAALEQFCNDRSITVSGLVAELITEFLKQQECLIGSN